MTANSDRVRPGDAFPQAVRQVAQKNVFHDKSNFRGSAEIPNIEMILMKTFTKLRRWTVALSMAVLMSVTLTHRLAAQDQQDDPPTRVARLGYLQGSVSFQPSGESDWVEAAPNRPMTTGDQLWADRDSRAELQLGTAVIELDSNTGVSILNLDDRTVQLQLSSGAINIRVRRLGRDDDFEIDTPNMAFTIFEAGRYRVEASEDGTYSVVSVRQGEGESTGNGATYTVRTGERVTFDGTDTLNAQVEDLGGPDDFDNWSDTRYRHYEESPSGRYVSRDVVGYEDLDDNGDWRPAMGYGNVWFPHVAAGWAPYREGHWAWIDPWGWTWVDDEQWGYAPFHYGRWASIDGRWGWIPGPMEVAPVYAPALVVFVGGGPGGFGGNIGWFPLGPREVYVPSYPVSRGYINQVNVSNTVVNTTTITNVYNTTIVNKTTNITNVTYVNRGVAGAVTAVPQQAFVSAQPVGRSAVAVNAKQAAAMQVSSRAAVAPTANSVLGLHANTSNHAAAPPRAVAQRAIVAKRTPPPAPVPFAARQQALAAHPGQPIAKQQMQQMQQSRPAATAAAARPQVKVAPQGKPATATPKAAGNAPGNRPGNPPGNRPGNAPAANQPMNRPGENQPANRPGNVPPTNRPPENQPASRPGNAPAANQPMNRPEEPPVRNERPPSAQPPANRPAPVQPPSNRPEPNRPQPNPPAPTNRPAEPPQRNEPAARPAPPPQHEPAARPAEPPQRNEPAARPAPPPQREPAARPAPPPQHSEPAARPAPPPHQQTPAEKKQQEEQRKKEEKPPGY